MTAWIETKNKSVRFVGTPSECVSLVYRLIADSYALLPDKVVRVCDANGAEYFNRRSLKWLASVRED